MSDKNYSPEVAYYYQLALKTIEVVKRERDRLKAREKVLEDALKRYAEVRDGYGNYSAKQALAAKEPTSLLRSVSDKAPEGCHCSPGNCMAPIVMGFQTSCRDPRKAATYNHDL